MITHGSDTVSFYVTSTFKNNALCEEVLSRILDLDVFKNHLSWFGTETMYQKATAKNIKDACAFGENLNTVRIVLKK